MKHRFVELRAQNNAWCACSSEVLEFPVRILGIMTENKWAIGLFAQHSDTRVLLRKDGDNISISIFGVEFE